MVRRIPYQPKGRIILSKVKDLTGMKFGRLTVIGRNGSTKQGTAIWHCRCECGQELDVRGYHLREGNSTSCGCFRRESCWDINRQRNTVHGDSISGIYNRLYHVWENMRERCLNANSPIYPLYGGRGIRICPEWDDYQNFKRWALSTRYDPLAPRGICTLDRIDCDGDYSPENCRWVDMKIQAENRRSGRSATGQWTKAQPSTNKEKTAPGGANTEDSKPNDTRSV